MEDQEKDAARGVEEGEGLQSQSDGLEYPKMPPEPSYRSNFGQLLLRVASKASKHALSDGSEIRSVIIQSLDDGPCARLRRWFPSLNSAMRQSFSDTRRFEGPPSHGFTPKRSDLEACPNFHHGAQLDAT